MAAPEFRHLTVLFLLALAAACSAAPQSLERWSPPEGASPLAREAQAFMESYARDLRAGERARLAARYHPEGAYLVGEGRKRFLLPDSLQAIYSGPWEPPTSFEWRDLSYEVVGPDAVVVIGQFLWGENAGGLLERCVAADMRRQAVARGRSCVGAACG